MQKPGASKELLSEIRRVATARQDGDLNALLHVSGLPDEECEAAWLLNQMLEMHTVSARTDTALFDAYLDAVEFGMDTNHCIPLTSVYSRRYLEESIEPLIGALSRAAGTLSVMMVDIDCFKKFNDAYGHIEGDECLRIVAEILQRCTMQKEDYVARYGGEEFVVILPNTDEAGARKIAGKMLYDVWERNILHPKSTAEGRVTISIGVVCGKVKHTHKRDDYLRLAGEMLRQSKQGGRNRYTYTDL